MRLVPGPGGSSHRVWCALWADQAYCSCGHVDVEDLVEWWAAAAARTSSRDSTVRLVG